MATSPLTTVYDKIKPLSIKQVSSEMSPEQAMDVLEVSTQTEDPLVGVQELSKQPADQVRELRKSVAQQEASEITSVLKADVEGVLSSPSVPTKDKVKMLEDLDPKKWTGNLLLTDMQVATAVEKQLELHRNIVENVPTTPVKPQEPETWRERLNEVMGVHNFSTEAQRKDYFDGLLDSALETILFAPMWVRGMMDESAAKEQVAWEQYRSEQKDKSKAYKEGSFTGGTIGFLVDVANPAYNPFISAAVGFAKTPFITFKTATALRQYSKLFGTERTLGFLTKSGDALAGSLRHDEKLMLQILRDTAGRTDLISQKLYQAAETAANIAVPLAKVNLKRASISPMARVATAARLVGDEAGINAAKEAVMIANAPVKQVGTAREAFAKAIDAGDSVSLAMIPDLEAPTVAVTKLGTEAANASKLGAVVADQILYDVMVGKQTAMAAVHTLRVAPQVARSGERARALEFGLTGGDEVFQAAKPVALFDSKFAGQAYDKFVRLVTHNKLIQNSLQKEFGRQLSIVYRGLNKGETNLLNQMIRTADDVEDWGEVAAIGYKIGDSEFLEATPKIIDAFKARQIMMGNTQKLLNASAVQQANQKGWKYIAATDEVAVPIRLSEIDDAHVVFDIHGGSHEAKALKFIEQNPIPISEATDEVVQYIDDFAHGVYEITNPKWPNQVMYRYIDESKVTLTAIPPNKGIIGNLRGYMHHSYKDKYQVIRIVTGAKGNVVEIKPFATSPTWKQAATGIEGFPTQAGENGLEYSYAAVRASEGTRDFVFSKNFSNIFKRMSDPEYKAFIEQGRFDAQTVKDLEGMRNRFGYKGGPPLMTRRETPLPSLGKGGELVGGNIKLGKEADAAYMDWASKYLSEGEYVQKLEKAFQANYGQAVKQLVDDPYAAIVPTKSIEFEALAYQKQLKVITGRLRSYPLRVADAVARTAADKMIRMDNPAIAKTAEWMAEKLPLPSGALGVASKFTTISSLGLMAMVQLPLQFSAAFINTIGTTGGKIFFEANRVANIKAAIQSQFDFAGYLAVTMGKRGGGEGAISKSMRETWDFVEQSGVAAGIDWDDFGRVLSDPNNMRALSNFVDKLSFPFKQGEKMGQVYGLLTAKRLLEAEGKLIAGTPKFMEAVIDRSKQISLNMMKHNQAGIFQGEITSAILKFKEFGVKQGALFSPFGKHALPKSELLGLYAAWLGAFGPMGIPFAWDALVAAELLTGAGEPDKNAGEITLGLAQELSQAIAVQAAALGMPVKSKTIQHWMEGGPITAASDGDIRIAQRFAIASFFADYLIAGSKDEAMLGAVYTKHKRLLFNDLPESLDALMSMVHTDSFSVENVAKVGEPLINQLTGPASLVKLMRLVTAEVDENGILRYKDRQGRTLLVNPNLTEKLQIVAGVTPGKLVNAYHLRGIQNRQKLALDAWMKESAKEIAQAKFKNQEWFDYNMEVAKETLREAGYIKLIGTLQMKVLGEKAMLKETLSLEEQILLNEFYNIKATGHFNSVWKELNPDAE